MGNSIPRTRPPPVLHITYQQPTSQATNKYQQGGSLPFQSHRTRPHFLCPPWVPSFHQLSSILTHRNHMTAINQKHTSTAQHCLYIATYLHTFCHPEASLKEGKLTGLPGLINWTAEPSWAQVTWWVWLWGSNVSTSRRKVGAVNP